MNNKFKFNALLTISITTIVEANSYEEALEIVKRRQDVEYHQGYNEPEEVWVVDEFDGIPYKIELNQDD